MMTTGDEVKGGATVAMVLYDSPEAASQRTVSGWVSRTGRFWGDDEHMARYDGATHRRCETDGCDSIIEIRGWTKCDSCRRAADAAHWAALPESELTPESHLIYSAGADQYFSGWDEVLEHAECHDIHDLNTLRLQPTEPHYLHEIDEDTWCDDLAEDGELSDVSADVSAALEALNAAIRGAGPSCWFPAKARLVIPSDIVEQHAERMRDSQK